MNAANIPELHPGAIELQEKIDYAKFQLCNAGYISYKLGLLSKTDLEVATMRLNRVVWETIEQHLPTLTPELLEIMGFGPDADVKGRRTKAVLRVVQ